MHQPVVSAVLLGLSALVIAAPQGSYSTSLSKVSATPITTLMIPETSTLSTLSAEVTGNIVEQGGEEIFEFPLSNGFPNPSPAQLQSIQLEAHGTLPNGPAPPTLQNNTVVSMGFLAFNELFEIAFFTELIENITLSKPGYDNVPDREEVLAILEIVQAQEQEHYLFTNSVFKLFSGQNILPCEYKFPGVNSFISAISTASMFTDLSLGIFPDIQTLASQVGDSSVIRVVGSVDGQEAEQNGAYRLLLGKVPSALPFLTAVSRDFGFSIINQNFVVPGTCPSNALISPPLVIFGTLTVLTNSALITSDADTLVQYQINLATLNSSITSISKRFSGWNDTSSAWPKAGSQPTGPSHDEGPWHGKTPSEIWDSISGEVFLTYVNQQNLPFSEPLQDVQVDGDLVTFKALFPGKTHEMNGLTIAAVTIGNGPFASVDNVESATLFGPGIIEVQ